MSQSDVPTRNQQVEGDRPDPDVEPDGDGLLDGRPVGRRTLMKGIGATAAGGVALGSDYGMVDDAEALIGTTTVLVGGAIVASGVIGWTLREYEVLGSDSPAEGLTADALRQEVFQTARTRKSTNASTFVDNRNIIESGLPNTLYAEGKIAAIEALNAEKSQSAVETAAHDAMNKYATTIQKNLLKSWNETVAELNNSISSLESHPDVVATNVIKVNTGASATLPGVYLDNHSATLADGTTFSLHGLGNGNGWDYGWSVTTLNTSNDTMAVVAQGDTDTFEYLSYQGWNGLWSQLQTTISNVESGLTTWVNNTYDQVQSGSIEVAELITPRERSKMIAADDGAAQAIADLYALGIPVDAGNEYTITVAETGATIRGTLAITDDSQAIESGSTYNPSADTFSGDAFFTYDLATASGEWSAYEQGIDGGVVTFTEEPYDGALFELSTSKNETVSVSNGNFTPTDGNGTEVDPVNATAWEYDASSDLESDIADVTGVDFYSDVDQSQMETIRLTDQFTVKKIVNAETDEEVETASFEQSDPQTDSNYITQEEWDQLQQQNEELIEKYEASQNTGGGGIDLSQFDAFGLPGELVAGGVGTLAILFGLNN